MYEREKQREIHLMILLCYTIFTIILVVESIFVKWNMGAVILIILGIIASWVIHILGNMTERTRLWTYFILMMLTFYFYGIHEDSTYNLAPVMAVVIVMYSATDEKRFVRLCALIYYLTICYQFVFVIGNPFDLPRQLQIRLLLHFGIVLMAERLIEIAIRWRRKDRSKTEETISDLKEINRRAEDFLANMSHELRTPINAVTGITAVMLKNEEDAEKKKDIQSIQMAGNRLFNQIEDILDYTEVDGGSVIVTEENYTISSLIQDIIIGNRLTSEEIGIELMFDVEARIPAVLLGDGRKIKKIMQHLIDNAIKFTKKGGVYVRVYALRKPYGINLCIQVSDTGIGIAENELGKIKEKFFQSNGGRNRKSSGLGLGLPIVYGMVAAMEGFMQIESTEGNGTTVSVSIPQKVADTTPSIVIANPEKLCVGCYLLPEKYATPEVREYYNTVISHMVQELNITIHRVFRIEELKKLVAMYQLTHLLIAREEYEENASYFETLESDMEVIVVTDGRLRPIKDSQVKVIRKPFYVMPFAKILSSQISSEKDLFEKNNIVCPGVRILVVDDEPMNLMVAEGIFNAYQMKVKTVGSGAEAIELCEKEDFDLVFLDHMMPEMDGVETLKILRKTWQKTEKVPVFIAFTANAVSGAREMFLQEGFDEFISKPIEDQELKRLLRKVLPETSIVYVEENEQRQNAEQDTAAQTTVEQAHEEESVTGNDTLGRLEKKGIHTENGLVYCRGDKEYYEQLIGMFAKNGEKKIADIESSYQKEDYKNYQIMVHALKSSSKMVGADTLSEMAKAVEEAAKNQDIVYIRENHGELITKYQKTIRTILEVLGSEDTNLSGENVATGTEVSKEELLKLLSELKENLDLFEASAAENLLEQTKDLVYQGASVKELMQDVSQDVENFELVLAAEKVEALAHSIESGEV
ncbi:MAG: response regulator [Lachnospiraceae bacterium]|nr:response regulator [Lachnospiraceae bacterium]